MSQLDDLNKFRKAISDGRISPDLSVKDAGILHGKQPRKGKRAQGAQPQEQEQEQAPPAAPPSDSELRAELESTLTSGSNAARRVHRAVVTVRISDESLYAKLREEIDKRIAAAVKDLGLPDDALEVHFE